MLSVASSNRKPPAIVSSVSHVSRSSVVVASEDQASSGLGEEAVILDFNQSMYFGLDPVGTFIWQQLQEPVRVTAVCEAVVPQYGVEAERCATQLERWFKQRRRQQREQRSGTPAAPAPGG